MKPFAMTIDAAKKFVVSSTLDQVDWNAELVRGDLGKAVKQLKREAGQELFVGGVTLPLALAEMGLIDEYVFVVHPRLAGHGPTLFDGLSKPVELERMERLEVGSGAVATRFRPGKQVPPMKPPGRMGRTDRVCYISGLPGRGTPAARVALDRGVSGLG